MLGTGHHFTGALMGVAVAGLAWRFGAHIPDYDVALIAIAGWYGGVAPDRLEIRRNWRDKKGFHSKTLIPHRTFTHVFLFWATMSLMIGGALVFKIPIAEKIQEITWILLGFFLGGLTHIVVDWPNPMGIPLIHPQKRHSLKLWRSGEYEVAIIAVFALFAWACWGFPH